MSAGAVIAVVVAVLVILVIVAAGVLLTRAGGAASPGLKRRFGPEYERTLARHDGDGRTTRRELSERVKRYGGIELRPLSAAARERHAASWTAVQARFVDAPGAAVAEADRLVAGLAAERGFPGAESPEHFDALSVHHPHEVQGYRHAHALAERGPAGGGPGATEDLRQALLGARGLFDKLLHEAVPALRKGAAQPEPSPTPSGAPPEPAAPESPDGDADVSEPDRRRPLSTRLAALTGGSRKGQATSPQAPSSRAGEHG